MRSFINSPFCCCWHIRLILLQSFVSFCCFCCCCFVVVVVFSFWWGGQGKIWDGLKAPKQPKYCCCCLSLHVYISFIQKHLGTAHFSTPVFTWTLVRWVVQVFFFVLFFFFEYLCHMHTSAWWSWDGFTVFFLCAAEHTPRNTCYHCKVRILSDLTKSRSLWWACYMSVCVSYHSLFLSLSIFPPPPPCMCICLHLC